MEEAYESAQKVTYLRNRDWLDSPWDDFFKKRDPLKIPATGIAKDQIELIIDKFSSTPEGRFSSYFFHPSKMIDPNFA